MVRQAVIIARAKSNGSWSSQNVHRFEVVTSKGDASFWVQVYERVRDIEEVHNLRVSSITVSESS